MNLPDYAHLTLGQIAGHLIPLAFLVFAAGLGRAIAARTVLWTYVKGWVVEWIGPALILVATAAVARGIPGLLEPNDLIGVLFIPAVAAYVVAAIAAIAKSLGVDLSQLPFAENVRAAFDTIRVPDPVPTPAPVVVSEPAAPAPEADARPTPAPRIIRRSPSAEPRRTRQAGADDE